MIITQTIVGAIAALKVVSFGIILVVLLVIMLTLVRLMFA